MFHWVSPLPLLNLTNQSLWSLPVWLAVCFRPPDDMLSYSNILETEHHHHCCCCNRHNLTSTTFVSFLSAEVKMILKELRSLTRRLREKDEEDLIINDWKFGNKSFLLTVRKIFLFLAAMVIDRFCLIGLSLYTALTTMVLFLSAPHLIVTWLLHTTLLTTSFIAQELLVILVTNTRNKTNLFLSSLNVRFSFYVLYKYPSF